MKKEYVNQFEEVMTDEHYIEDQIDEMQMLTIIKLLNIIAIILALLTIGIFIIVAIMLEFRISIIDLVKELQDLTIK